ncbi:ABC transporter ATP-binding protein [Hydrogenovibrio halophilus]|uniref:ABC transporter ATP-binding protein n=1 Tax=Hydrogenovibrio halophilus TaxID=373391 RepID=UPI0003704DA2|nr:ABC transporter ATP-binding protein [Hydrogenovibrio halophilus]
MSIQISQLTKRYTRYASGWHRILKWLGFQPRPASVHTVIEDISFSLPGGQALALVGQNGAGKSTLLKMIAGTLPPTYGTVAFQGRVAAILELSLGFHPEFTGRENALHALKMLGLPQPESLLQDVRTFSELGDFFEQPLRTYSSGMQMRLAFSAVTAVRPDILIIDEALSVGDSYFQHKSFDRIRQFKQQGTTLLFVSHDKSAVLELCDRALLIDQGRLAMDGDPADVMDYYNALVAQKEDHALIEHASDNQTRSGSKEVTIDRVQLLDRNLQPVEQISVGQAVTLRLKLSAHQTTPDITIGLLIKNRVGHDVFGTNTFHLGHPLNLQPGKSQHIDFAFPANLGPGSYSVTVAVHRHASHLHGNIDWFDRALVFEVHNTHHPEFIGTAWLPTTTSIPKL